MTKSELHQMIDGSTGNESNICQIYAVKDGFPVYEDCWHGYHTDDAVNVMSVTKGVMALLVGIAIDKKIIENVDTAGWGLCLSAKDMARIGQMILNGGVFDVRKVISSEWMDDMTSPHLVLNERFGNMSYGYLWYRPFKDRQVYAAIGDGSNVIYVNKENHIAVGVTGTFKPHVFDRVDFIEKYIITQFDKKSE